MDDLISRRAAIDAMCNACSDWCDEGVCKKVSAIGNLSSAQRKGKWIRENIVLISTPPQYQWHCSGCGRLVRGFSTEILTDFCPNCGARMEKGEEDGHNTNDNTGN